MIPNRAELAVLAIILAFAACIYLAVDAIAAPTRGQPAYVSRVIDGDTIHTTAGRVRLLGIDTPETHGGTEPCGPSATEAMMTLVEDENVTLYSDAAQGNTDRYGRLLRYVHAPNPTGHGNIDASRWMVQQGWARVYLEYPVARTPVYLRAERVAQRHHRGIWAAQPCDWEPR